MANLPMAEDAFSIEITPQYDSKARSHRSNSWHGLSTIRLSSDVEKMSVEEIDDNARVAEAGDDGGRRSLHGSARRYFFDKSDSKARSHGSRNWHGLGSISLPRDEEERMVEDIDDNERVAEAGDDGGRRSLRGSARREITENIFESGVRGVGVVPNDALIYSYPSTDPTYTTTSSVSPLTSDIILLPASDHPLLIPKGGDVNESNQQHPQHEVNQNQKLNSFIMEYILILSLLGLFGIIGIFVRYSLQVLFGPHVANVTNVHSALYIDLPSNMVGSFFMGWVGVVFKRNISIFSEALTIGLSTGLMGSITTFTSWIQAIVKLTTGGKWVIGIIGLLLGMELAQMSLELGIESARLIVYVLNRIKKHQSNFSWIPSTKYCHHGLYGFITCMFIIGILWGGSLVLSVFDFRSHHETKLWIACTVGPFGVWIRWYLARFNGQGFGKKKHLKWLPLGTLVTNLVAAILMASLSIIHIVVKDYHGKIIIEGLELGFLGNLSTVSTFVVEVRAMHQSNSSWRAYVYILLSLFPAFILGTLIYSIPIWTRGYSQQ